jgi:acyl carrier protein
VQVARKKDPMIDRIRKVVNESSFLQAGTTVADGDDLYAAGLTSHASVELMLQLEDEFNIEFPERLLKRSTFESISSLSDALAGLTA